MNTSVSTLRPTTLLLCALGGEGGGVLAEWLIDTAIATGYPAQSTSVPGVAQRTGATTYYVEVFPVHQDKLAGKRPVFSLNPVPGTLDMLVSSELLETARQVGNGFASPDRTLLISSSSRALTTAERMVMGDGRVDDARLMDVIRRLSREHHVFDMAQVAQRSGTVISAVMFGAIAASGVLPFSREACEATIRQGGRGVEASLRGFGQAYDIVAGSRAQGSLVEHILADDTDDVPPPALLPPEASAFPPSTHAMLGAGYARVCDYQNTAYGQLYLARLGRILEAERAADPAGAHGFATTREAARYLALWMAFDDVVRVAHLKSRAGRARRVRDEVRAGEDDIVRVYDHFKPGIPEFAGLLPAGLAQRLLRWDRQRQAKGRDPWSMPLKIGAHSVRGLLALRMLAATRGLRRFGSRYAQEQQMIERWVDAVVATTRQHWRTGNEVALVGRLIKGYGTTNDRAKDNLLHVLEHLVPAPFPTPDDRAQAIADARNAALTDEAGKALDATLMRHGAPARPMKEVPVRWVKRQPAQEKKAA
ncbi:indolepyruvate oxidoreductase subunit beta family protein [Achromobacter sp. GG226]|uniref:indolepyruvate oxidoreductase subunit beta family protein n=1 Tax=Verticiella alkaliphila TaxID=2779529 RepID=UPI001C0D62D6|nr:indolepyruvate oxidoreductase subunit beta family protein [Verticiella sp. GG226]MBU4610592.1 indolepyruvate oxidoreductase subunit beta family protein [Verticiella sp. GG226]